MREYAAEELEKSREALSDVSVLDEGEASDAAIVNRLYYACFHAATAALYSRGFDPTSHRGTLALFGSELVMEGFATKDDGRLLNRMRDFLEEGAVEPVIDRRYPLAEPRIECLGRRASRTCRRNEARACRRRSTGNR